MPPPDFFLGILASRGVSSFFGRASGAVGLGDGGGGAMVAVRLVEGGGMDVMGGVMMSWWGSWQEPGWKG